MCNNELSTYQSFDFGQLLQYRGRTVDFLTSGHGFDSSWMQFLIPVRTTALLSGLWCLDGVTILDV